MKRKRVHVWVNPDIVEIAREVGKLTNKSTSRLTREGLLVALNSELDKKLDESKEDTND